VGDPADDLWRSIPSGKGLRLPQLLSVGSVRSASKSGKCLAGCSAATKLQRQGGVRQQDFAIPAMQII